MAMRFWSSRIHGLSLATFPAINPSYKLQCHFPTVKASLSATTGACENGFPLVSEDSVPVVRKKERLTRQERADVIESFVRKYMEDHGGSFPNVSAVLKSTGGSRNVVKEILSDLEKRYVHLTTSENHTGSASIVDASGESDGKSYSEYFDVGEGEAGVSYDTGSKVEDEDEDEDESEEEGTFYTSGYGDEENDDEEGVVGESEEFESSGEQTSGKHELGRERGRSNNSGMIESNQGDYETQSRLSSRLRGMGMSSSLQQSSGHDLSESQRSSGRFRPAGLAGSSLPRQDFSESEWSRENGTVPEWQTLNVSNSAEKRLRSGAHSRGRTEDVSGTRSNERHGLFVRYLSCHANSSDLREAFEDCGEIVRAYAIRARPNVKYTYGFVDFKTIESLQKALAKGRVYIRGNRILTEPSTTAPNSSSKKIADDSRTSNVGSSESDTALTSQKVFDTQLDSSHGKAIRETGYKVAVMGIPMNVPLSDVQGALSKYGEIVLSDMKQESEGTYSANLEFEVMDERDKALAAKSVQLDGSHYSIFRVNPLKTSVVRLSNVGRDANLDQVGSTCELFGRVTEVISRCDGSVDVYFQTTEVENIPKILTRLNQVTMDGRRWQARSCSRLDSASYESLLQTRGGQEWLQLESERMLSKVESALKKLVVDVEDLQELVIVNRCYTGLPKNSGNGSAL